MSMPPADPGPTVSVVMTVYNTARYLAAAIDSVLTQTYAEYELIVVDDGSTDGSAEILKRYAEEHPARVRVLTQANAGVVAAANAGMAMARGRLVARMDSDDLSLPDRLARQVAHFDAHADCVLLGTGVMMVDPYGSPIGPMPVRTSHEEIEQQLMTAAGGTALVQPSTMMRAEAVRAVGGYRGTAQLAEDLDLFLRLAEVGRVANLPEVLLHYRRHPGSLTHTHAHEQGAAEAAIADARRRRGLPPLEPGSIRPWTPLSPRRQASVWGWAALRAGNVAVARRHAWSAVRSGPWSTDAWRLMYCAARGR